MAKVHITLVGGAAMPLYQGILYSKPDKIVYIYSKETTDQAKSIYSTIEEAKYILGLSHTSQVLYDKLFPVNDVIQIEELAKEVIQTQTQKGDEISINLSGGAKIWDAIFQKISIENVTRYCISQDGVVLYTDPELRNVSTYLDMFVQCNFMKYKRKRYIAYTDYTDEDRNDYETIKSLYMQDGFPAFLDRMMNQYQKSRKAPLAGNVFFGDDFKSIAYNHQEKSFTVTFNDEQYQIHGPHAVEMLLDSGWVKYNVASLIAEIYGPENIYTNCIFTDNQNEILEMDLMVKAGNKVLFVECQSGNQLSTLEDDRFYNGILNSFKSNINACGGLASKALFVTYSPIALCEKLCNETQKPHIEYFYTHNADGRPISVDELRNKIDSFINTTNV